MNNVCVCVCVCVRAYIYIYRETSQILTVTTGMHQKVGQREWNRLRKRIYECGGKVKPINMTDDYPVREESFPVALRSTFHYFAYQLSYYYHFSYKFHLSQRHSFRITTFRTFCLHRITRQRVIHISFLLQQKRDLESTLSGYIWSQNEIHHVCCYVQHETRLWLINVMA